MQRFLVAGAMFLLCSVIVGCTGETYDGLISDTIQLMSLAETEVGNIKTRVQEAVKKADKGEGFDLSDAIAACAKLKETGMEAQKLKQKIEYVKSQVTEENRKINVEKQKGKLNAAFQTLLEQRDGLQKALRDAERHGKTKVDDLRKKIVEAEGPFEALSR